jgi:hypothetical protein
MRLCFASFPKADRAGTNAVAGRFRGLPLWSADMNGIIYLVGLVVVVLAVLSFFGLH